MGKHFSRTMAALVIVSFTFTFLVKISMYLRMFPLSPNGEVTQQAFNVSAASSPSTKLKPTKLSLALEKLPLGQLGPKNTTRQNLRYYDTLFYTALQFGRGAKSLLEVGCAADPFIKYFEWIDRRTCVAPYFIDYSAENSDTNNQLNLSDSPIEFVVADFMEYDLAVNSYDLLICSQVIEHVPKPSSFMKKLIRSAKTSIISVPFKWGSCGEQCNHLTDNITYKLALKWSSPYKPIFTSIVQEKANDNGKGSYKRRLVLVFKHK